MTSVLVMGSTGMLGSMILDEFANAGDYDLRATTRDGKLPQAMPGVTAIAFDAERDDPSVLLAALPASTWIINAIGIIKPYINESSIQSRATAIAVNAMFPHRLAAAAQTSGHRVIQIATDCVYSGRQGGYDESATHDALDVYGKSKSLGEIQSDAMMHLRVSIIGPEKKAHVSLLDWFRGLDQGAEVTGFTDHLWNGVTTLQYAKIVKGIIDNDRFVAGVHHVVPTSALTKAEMLMAFASAFDRPDVIIKQAAAPMAIDRTLSTANPAANQQRWADAGYAVPPTVPEMIAELASREAATA